MRTARRVVYRTLWQGSTMNLDSHLTGQSGVNCKFITPPASQRRRTRVYRKARAPRVTCAAGRRPAPSAQPTPALGSRQKLGAYLPTTYYAYAQSAPTTTHTYTHTHLYIYIYIYKYTYICARTTSSNTSSKSSSKPATIPTTIYTIYCY